MAGVFRVWVGFIVDMRRGGAGDPDNNPLGIPGDIADFSRFTTKTFYVLFTIFTLLASVGVITMGAIYSNKDSSISSQMVVMTSERSRDWSSPNAYSMHYQSMDEHSRLYLCMQQTGLTTVDATLSQSLNVYREHIKKFFTSKGRNCDAESSNTWPRDYGFLKCIQSLFPMTVIQTNVYLHCLDSTEGVMVASIQPPSTMLFMGSYNFVAFLLTGGAILVTFMIFTMGGWFWSNEVEVGSEYWEIRGVFVPFGTAATWVAFLVSLLWVVLAGFYTFPIGIWSDVPAQADRHAFPNTPWTGFVCLFGLVVNFLCFAGYLVQCYDNVGNSIPAASGMGHSSNIDGSDIVYNPAGGEGNDNSSDILYRIGRHPRAKGVMEDFIARQREARRQSNDQASDVLYRFGRNQRARSTMEDFISRRKDGSYARSRAYEESHNPMDDGFFSEFNIPHTYHGLSARYPGTGQYTSPVHPSSLNGFFFQATTLGFLLCDQFIFVGMITPQHSPLRESVIALMSSVLLCRFAQFAASFFRSDNIAHNDGNIDDVEKSRSNYRDVGFIAGQIASLSFSVEVFSQLGSVSAFVVSLNSNEASTPIFLIYIFFIIVMVAFEVARHALSFLHIGGALYESTFVFWLKVLFLIECLARLGFIFGTIVSVTDHLSGENQNLVAFLGPP